MDVEGKNINKIVLIILGIVFVILFIYIIGTILKNNEENRRLENLSNELKASEAKEEEKQVEVMEPPESELSDSQQVNAAKALIVDEELGTDDISKISTAYLESGYVITKNISTGETNKFESIKNAKKMLFSDTGFTCRRNVYMMLVLTESGNVYMNRLANATYLANTDPMQTGKFKMYFSKLDIGGKATDITMKIIETDDACDTAEFYVTLENKEKKQVKYNVYSDNNYLYYYSSIYVE